MHNSTCDHVQASLDSPGLITVLSLIATAITGAVGAYLKENRQLRDLKSQQLVLHRENNDIKRMTPKSSGTMSS